MYWYARLYIRIYVLFDYLSVQESIFTETQRMGVACKTPKHNTVSTSSELEADCHPRL